MTAHQTYFFFYSSQQEVKNIDGSISSIIGKGGSVHGKRLPKNIRNDKFGHVKFTNLKIRNWQRIKFRQKVFSGNLHDF